MRCPKCKTQRPSAQADCENCKPCHHCGSLIERDATRCPECEEFIGNGWMKSHREWIAVGFSILTLITSGIALYIAWGERTDKQDALARLKLIEAEMDSMKKESAAKRTGKSFEVDENLIVSGEDKHLLEKAIADVGQGDSKSDVETMLRVAFSLKAQEIKYVWNGKEPAEGFDSSGFIAYLLAQAGKIRTVEVPQFWSGRIRETVRTIGREELSVGDLVFYPQGFILLYIGNDQGIGMSSTRNLFVMKMVNHASVVAYGRWTGLPRIK